jgi:hypothetical protein
MVASDTSAKAAERQIELYRQLDAGQRSMIAADLSDDLREIAREGVHRRHPEFNDQQVTDELLWIFYSFRRPRPAP